MQVWEQWESWRRLSSIAGDGLSSATVLGEQALRAMRLLVDYMHSFAPETFPDAALAAVAMLAKGQHSVAPIANLQNVVHLACETDVETLSSELDDLLSRVHGTWGDLAVSAELITPGATVMVHSSSSTVMAMLLAATNEFRVVCTEALPGGEGREMASNLVERGFEVELLSNAEAANVVAGMDLILVGADAIGPGRSINKVGTCELAEEAHAFDVPIYTVASLAKVLPEELFERAATESTYGAIGAIPLGVGGLAEVVPLSWFSGVITEKGVITPGDLSKRATEQIVARSLR